MAQTTTNTGGAPTKPPVNHSKTKEEKQAKHLAKKARRAANIAAKQEQEDTVLFAKFAIAIVTDKLTAEVIRKYDEAVAAQKLVDEIQAKQKETENGTNDGNNDAADSVADSGTGISVESVAADTPSGNDPEGTSVADTGADPEPAVQAVAETDGVTDLPPNETRPKVIAIEAAEASVRFAEDQMTAPKPDGMSSKAWGKEKWQRKTALAAANAALFKLRVAADVAKLVEGRNDAPVETSSAAALVAAAKATVGRVVPTNADFVSSVNADYDNTEEAMQPKVATLNGKSFEAPKPILDGTENDESVTVDPALVEHGSFAAIDAAEKAKEAEVEEVAEPAAEETPAETPAAEPEHTGTNDPTGTPDEETPAEPAPVEEKPAEPAAPEPTKPTLAVNNDTAKDRADLIMAASKFYGSWFNATNQEKLTAAYRCLGIALKAEANGNKSGMELALKTAIKHENEAFEMSAVNKAA